MLAPARILEGCWNSKPDRQKQTQPSVSLTEQSNREPSSGAAIRSVNSLRRFSLSFDDPQRDIRSSSKCLFSWCFGNEEQDSWTCSHRRECSLFGRVAIGLRSHRIERLQRAKLSETGTPSGGPGDRLAQREGSGNRAGRIGRLFAPGR